MQGCSVGLIFEKLLCLQNKEVDKSDAASVTEPMPSGEIRVESLLDTLLWATHKFGSLSQVMTRMWEASEKIGEASCTLGPKIEGQQQTLTRVNCSLKEHMLSQGKLLGEASVTATKSFEVLASLCEGVDGLQETQKETNTLFRELIEGQKMALKEATKAPTTAPAFPPQIQPSWQWSYPARCASCIPELGISRNWSSQNPRDRFATASHGTQCGSTGGRYASYANDPDGTEALEREGPPGFPPPGFKRVRLASGQYMTVPQGWAPDESHL